MKPGRHCPCGLSDAENSVLLNVLTSVPSSGRPICESICVTSGDSRNYRAQPLAMSADVLEGDILLQRGANPEIAFFQRRHELAADESEADHGCDQQSHTAMGPRNVAEAQSTLQQALIVLAQETAEARLA